MQVSARSARLSQLSSMGNKCSRLHVSPTRASDTRAYRMSDRIQIFRHSLEPHIARLPSWFQHLGQQPEDCSTACLSHSPVHVLHADHHQV
jgi:hypothetical protein